ncbi:solute carrier family 2 (facilitated glucose transporter), member 13 [Plakobranchus ocellatus]|uniref:Solute carrier family 2 (Facilitated glucose transporter), member 13 n=1 Tax=Plakobranchus ocellatus TaxID=259542 RepID=A0AAV4B9S6_9GAST|nr:solute carrier family 2 (facilitated glucose transporter), member 13 [Plakobranchus ocellatus]
MFDPDEEELYIETEQLMMSALKEDSNLVPTQAKPYKETSVNDDFQSDGRAASGDHNLDHGPSKPIVTTPYIWMLSAFAAIGGFLFGYDTGVVSGAMLLLKDEFSLSSYMQEIIVSSTIGAAFVFALLGGYLNDTFGRKSVTIVASFVFTAGAIVLGLAQNVTMLILGRLILGIGIGFASMTVPMYIAESSPPHLRGRLVTVNNMFITGGQFIASLMDGAFSYIKPDGWRFMLGLAGVPSAIQFVGFFFLPESPRWLIKKGKEDQAREVLKKLRGTAAVEEEIQEMRSLVESEAEHSHSGFFTIARIMKTPPVRRAVLVGCGLQLFQQLSGINTVMYYSASIIKMAGVRDQQTAIWLTSMTAGVNFAFTLIGLWLVERIGRRKLILSSLAGVIASLVVLGVAFQLIAYNTPPVSQFDPLHKNNSCSSYKWCEACIDDSSCGFCYRGNVGSINGSCLAKSPKKDTHSAYGPCEAGAGGRETWALDYCLTSYSWMAIFGLVLYLMFFAPGMGPMPWTINSEIYPLWARSTGNSLATATNWIANLAVSMTFLTLTETLTKAGTYWMFVGIASLGFVFISTCVPETKGVKLEEVESLFQGPLCRCCGSHTGPGGAQRNQYRVIDHTDSS